MIQVMAADPLHCPPRRPHAWLPVAIASQALVLLAWWQWGWVAGLALLLGTHGVFLWGVMKPDSRLFAPVLARLPTDQPVAWLTIDDGPSGDTPAMLDLLDAHGAKATFFLVGARAAARPDLVREIVRRGHEVGNHSQHHPQAWFWALGPKRMQREVAEAQELLTRLAGMPPRWFRAVVGMANPFLAAPLREHGLARVAWSARGFDALEPDPGKVVARIDRDLRPGAIVLLHEGAGHGRNVETLARLLDLLDRRGYRCVVPGRVATTSQLLNGVRP